MKKNKRILKRALPFALACVSTIMLSTGCQKKSGENTNTEALAIVENCEIFVDNIMYINSDKIKVLEIYDQINMQTKYYFIKPTLNYKLDSSSAKEIALMRFNESEIEAFINDGNSYFVEDNYESIFKDGIYLWTDTLSVEATPYYASHTFTNIKGNDFYHLEIIYKVKKGDKKLQNKVETYTRINDILYHTDNKVYKIKLEDFNNVYEKGFYTYEELESILASLNKEQIKKLTNK